MNIPKKNTIGSADDFRRERVLASFEASLKDLRTDYVDVYMLHGPVNDMPATKAMRQQAWRTLEELYESGRARSLGVSNYNAPQVRGACSLWWLVAVVLLMICAVHLVT